MVILGDMPAVLIKLQVSFFYIERSKNMLVIKKVNDSIAVEKLTALEILELTLGKQNKE